MRLRTDLENLERRLDSKRGVQPRRPMDRLGRRERDRKGLGRGNWQGNALAQGANGCGFELEFGS